MQKKIKILKGAGIIAPVMYGCFVLLGGYLRPNYSPFSQTISTLVQIGAPNKLLLDIGFSFSSFCLALFGYGLFRLGRKESNRYKAFSGLTLIAGGIAGILIVLFPKDSDFVNLSLTGFVHHLIAGVLTIFAMISILFSELGEFNNGAFRSYSKISIILIFVFAAVTVVAGQSTNSLVGLFERITIFLYLQWMMVMSALVLKHSVSEKTSEKIKRISKTIIYKIKRTVKG